MTARVWRRYSPAQAATRWSAELALGVVTALMLWHVGVRWDYVADAPA